MVTLRPVSAAGLPAGPDLRWRRGSSSTSSPRRVVGRRLEEGATLATDEALDALMVLRAWTVKALRTAKGLSQMALAEKAHVSREYINRLERGQHDPALTTLVKLAKALGVPVAELLE